MLPPLAGILAAPEAQPDMLVEGALDLLCALVRRLPVVRHTLHSSLHAVDAVTAVYKPLIVWLRAAKLRGEACCCATHMTSLLDRAFFFAMPNVMQWTRCGQDVCCS